VVMPVSMPVGVMMIRRVIVGVLVGAVVPMVVHGGSGAGVVIVAHERTLVGAAC
jgi:hypothetical protein